MDLSILPDDQLLQLIEAVTKEVARRAIAIQAATNKYWQDTKEEILDNIKDCQAPKVVTGAFLYLFINI